MDIGIQAGEPALPPETSALPALLRALRAYVVEAAIDCLPQDADEHEREGARRDALKISQLPDDTVRRELWSAVVRLDREARRKNPPREPKPPKTTKPTRPKRGRLAIKT